MSKMLENSSAKYEEGHHMAWITLPCHVGVIIWTNRSILFSSPEKNYLV
jgi:hypothetical protein